MRPLPVVSRCLRVRSSLPRLLGATLRLQVRSFASAQPPSRPGPAAPATGAGAAAAAASSPAASSAPPSGSGEPSRWIVEVTAQNLQQIAATSSKVPVLLQATAAWCGPCKTLSPILEKVVKAHKGNVFLARLDVDKMPQFAQQLKIEKVPTVLVLFQGQIITSFSGALPEADLARFVNEVVSQTTGAPPAALEGLPADPSPGLLSQAEAALDGGDLQTASQLLTKVFQDVTARMNERKSAEEAAKKANSPELRGIREEQKTDFGLVVKAAAGLVRCAASAGDVDAARSVLSDLASRADEDLRLKAVADESKELVAARASVEMAGDLKGAGAKPLPELEAAAKAGDHAAAYSLAVRYFAMGRAEEAVEQCLAAVRRTKGEERDRARQLVLRFFTLLGPESPIAQKGRRRLTSALL